MTVLADATVIGLLALIATIDLAQFGITLEHRGRLATVEQQVCKAGPVRADGGTPHWVPDGPTEDSTARDGFLSYAKEWHASTIGVGAGAASAAVGSPEFAVLVIAVALGVRAAPTERLKQLVAEPWYAIGGTGIGYIGVEVARALPV